jgi:hypothetical protein
VGIAQVEYAQVKTAQLNLAHKDRFVPINLLKELLCVKMTLWDVHLMMRLT